MIRIEAIKVLTLVLVLLITHTALTAHAASHQVFDSVQCQVCIGDKQQSSSTTVDSHDWAMVLGPQTSSTAPHHVYASNPELGLYSPRAPPVTH